MYMYVQKYTSVCVGKYYAISSFPKKPFYFLFLYFILQLLVCTPFALLFSNKHTRTRHTHIYFEKFNDLLNVHNNRIEFPVNVINQKIDRSMSVYVCYNVYTNFHIQQKTKILCIRQMI